MRLPEKITGGPRNLVRWLNQLRTFVRANQILHGGVKGWNGSPAGVTPPTFKSDDGKGGCCGIGNLYCGRTFPSGAAFERESGTTKLVEISQGNYAGLVGEEDADGFYTFEFGSFVWKGNERGVDGVVFEGQGGSEDPATFTLHRLPESLVVTETDGTVRTLNFDTVAGDLRWSDGSNELIWDPFASVPSDTDTPAFVYNFQFYKGNVICDPVGEYVSFGDDVIHIGSTSTTGAAGLEGSGQFNSGGALMGSSNFKVVRLEPTP